MATKLIQIRQIQPSVGYIYSPCALCGLILLLLHFLCNTDEIIVPFVTRHLLFL